MSYNCRQTHYVTLYCKCTIGSTCQLDDCKRVWKTAAFLYLYLTDSILRLQFLNGAAASVFMSARCENIRRTSQNSTQVSSFRFIFICLSILLAARRLQSSALSRRSTVTRPNLKDSLVFGEPQAVLRCPTGQRSTACGMRRLACASPPLLSYSCLLAHNTAIGVLFVFIHHTMW